MTRTLSNAVIGALLFGAIYGAIYVALDVILSHWLSRPPAIITGITAAIAGYYCGARS